MSLVSMCFYRWENANPGVKPSWEMQFLYNKNPMQFLERYFSAFNISYTLGDTYYAYSYDDNWHQKRVLPPYLTCIGNVNDIEYEKIFA